MSSMVAIDQIIADSRCQSRTGIDLGLVQEYADAIAEGAELPPLSTIRAAEGYYLYDGFHRLEAYRQAGTKHVAITSRPGDVWDAIEASCAVNTTHGKRRTNADKHRAVETMLKVMAHRGENWSDSEIARRCAVSHPFVGSLRSSLVTITSDNGQRTYTTKHGTPATMNTANIGKKPAWQAPTIMVDRDTGEIVDDCPEAEEVDPNDPAAYVWERPPRPAPAAPAKPKYDVKGMEEIAAGIVHKYGRSAALRIADHIYEIAED